MAADIKENDFLLGDQDGKGKAVAMGETDSVATLQSAAQGMQFQMRLKRVCLQIAEHLRKSWLQVRMLLEEFAGLTEKLMRADDGVHYSGSSASRALSKSSAVLKVDTLPLSTSSRDARSRA